MTTTPAANDSIPFFPENRADPYRPPSGHEAVRDSTGLGRVKIWDGSVHWLVTKYSDARLVLSDPSFSADIRYEGFPRVSADKLQKDAGSFNRIDDPAHAKLRRQLTREFSVRRTRSIIPELRRITDELINDLLAQGPPANLIQDLALPIPTRAICLLMGIPYSEHRTFQRFSEIELDLTAPHEVKVANQREAIRYYTEFIHRKQREPGDDIISRLISESADEDAFSIHELPRLISILLSAGHETTASQIGLAVLSLLTHDHERQRLAEDEDAIGTIIEETLRYWSIVVGNPRRVALADVQLRNQVIRAGEGVIVSLTAANRDPDVFGSAGGADVVDSTRARPRQHLAFGFGSHQCLGQNLARAEMEVVLVRLLQRLPNLRLAVPVAQLDFKRNTHVYGLRALPVVWD